MDERLNNTRGNVDHSLCPDSHIVKGSIVLTPTNYVGRVKWVQSEERCQGEIKASVEYLEYSGGYNVYNISQLTLLAEGADRPKFDDISREQLEYQRQKYAAELRMIEDFPSKTKGKSTRVKSVEERIAEQMVKKLSPEMLAKLLEEL